MELLREPGVRDLEMDSLERFDAHRKVLDRKKVIRSVFIEIQRKMYDLAQRLGRATEGREIELGAGVFPMKESFPQILATDISKGPLIDSVLDAQKMDLPANSVKAFYGQNCFHHFPDPDQFFEECMRTLMPGGVVVIVDPADTPFAGIIYPRLFASEGYDKGMPGWKVGLTGDHRPNQALSHLVFVRDRSEFEKKYPSLKIVHTELLGNYARYLLSGGLNFRALLPSFLFPIVEIAEAILFPLRKIMGLHKIYVLQKG